MNIFIKLLLAFTLIPIIELALLIEIGSYIGVIPTIFLVGITGVVGVTLARNEGLLILSKIQNKLSTGEIPTSDMIEGLLILIGGVTLLTPGVLTDITGFLLIIPFTRPFFAKIAKKLFEKHIYTTGFKMHSNYRREKNQDDYVDIDYKEEDENK
jgi:UPF0716 protein FxsA